MIAPLVFGLLGVAVLVSLGVWQVHRLAWKTAILDEITARLAAAPVAVPEEPDPVADRYLRVRASGTIEPGETHVYTSAPPRGVGYRIVVPFVLADGRRILLDRGFVPIEEERTPRHLGPIAVEGNLIWPQEGNPEPDLDRNIWLARDTPRMAEVLGTLPVMLAVASSDDPDGPMPLPVTVNIPNDHLQYAITWFLLAVVWAVMTGYLLWRIKRRID